MKEVVAATVVEVVMGLVEVATVATVVMGVVEVVEGSFLLFSFNILHVHYSIPFILV